MATTRGNGGRMSVGSSAYLPSLVSGLPAGVLACDRELRCQVWNAWIEEVSGMPASEVVGRRLVDAFPQLRAQGLDGLLDRALAGEVVQLPDVRWQHVSHTIRVSVNLSGRQFSHHGLVAEVEESLKESGAPAGALELELTEASLIDDADRAAGVVEALSGVGVRLALDHFGTGYSSLGALHRFRLHGIKIDRSFVQALGDPAGEAHVVRGAIALGRSLELDVVAQGVETADQLERLRALDCGSVQGFYLARPQEPDAATALLRAGRLS